MAKPASASAKAAKAQDASYLKAGPIDVIRHRWVYLGIALALVLPGIVFMALMMMKTPNHAPLRLGIDFTGDQFCNTALRKSYLRPISLL